MKSNILFNYPPINFYKSLFWVFVKVFLVFLIGWIIFYQISNEARKAYLKDNLFISGLVFFLVIVIAIFQTWINSKIYIYQVEQNERMITFQWQELKLFKEISLPIEDVIVKLQPSGKNTPYLELKLVHDSSTEILKQTYYPGWNKNTMTAFIDKINEIKKAA